MAEPEPPAQSSDMFDLIFNPLRARPFLVDWPRVAQHMLARLHREVLQNPADARLAKLLDRVMHYPGVVDEWRLPDFGTEAASTLRIELCRGDMKMNFMTTLTTFAAPRMVTLEELRVESYFPLDRGTRQACERIAAAREG
jgi:hypothetical protein